MRLRTCDHDLHDIDTLALTLTWHPGERVVVDGLHDLVILEESLLASVGARGCARHCGAVQAILSLVLTSSDE